MTDNILKLFSMEGHMGLDILLVLLMPKQAQRLFLMPDIKRE